MRVTGLAAAFVMVFGLVASAGATTIEGQYAEVRSCDVFTAACFANSEVGLTGEEATLAWRVTEGAWNGVELDGLGVIAVVRASATLGDTTRSVFPTRSVLFVDENANVAQHEALVGFAKSMSDGLIEEIVRVETSPITFATEHCTGTTCAHIAAGESVEIATRCLHEADKKCGNDEAFYPPLTKIDGAMAQMAEIDAFREEGLGVTWDESGRRSAYLGTFAR